MSRTHTAEPSPIERWLGRVEQTGTWCSCLTAAQVALALNEGEKMLAELAKLFDVHPPQVTAWQAQLQEGGGQDRMRAAAPAFQFRT